MFTSRPRIFDVYSLLTMITPTILDVLDIVCGCKLIEIIQIHMKTFLSKITVLVSVRVMAFHQLQHFEKMNIYSRENSLKDVQYNVSELGLFVREAPVAAAIKSCFIT